MIYEDAFQTWKKGHTIYYLFKIMKDESDSLDKNTNSRIY